MRSRLSTFRVRHLALPLAAVAVSAAACSGGTDYYSTAETAPSATNAAPQAATVAVRTGPLGTYLTDAAGRTVYMFTADTAGTSTCDGDCATAWPPVTTDATPTAGEGTTGARLGTVRRPDGTPQVTYGGHPLYYFARDMAPGSTAGQGSRGFGAPWWVVSPEGTPIKAAAAPSSPSSEDSSDYGDGY